MSASGVVRAISHSGVTKTVAGRVSCEITGESTGFFGEPRELLDKDGTRRRRQRGVGAAAGNGQGGRADSSAVRPRDGSELPLLSHSHGNEACASAFFFASREMMSAKRDLGREGRRATCSLTYRSRSPPQNERAQDRLMEIPSV